MHPVPDHRVLSLKGLHLGDLGLVMGEDQVEAPAMDIVLLAKIFL